MARIDMAKTFQTQAPAAFAPLCHVVVDLPSKWQQDEGGNDLVPKNAELHLRLKDVDE